MADDPDVSKRWRRSHVTSPGRSDPVAVVAAYELPYLTHANRLQTLNLYLPDTVETQQLIDTPVLELPGLDRGNRTPSCLVHIHGGAWRSPDVTAASIEPTVAYAFASAGDRPLKIIASIDYSISPFPDAPSDPYDPVKDAHADPAREAVHPRHLRDVLQAFGLLRSLGLSDRSYVLSGHSCGACLAFQAVMADPISFGLHEVAAPPTPAAMLGVNGLYDLPDLVYGLDAEHAHLRAEYRKLLSIAFGVDETIWSQASPTRIGSATLAATLQRSGGPRAIMLEQSPDDQLVPMNQRATLATALAGIEGMTVFLGDRCSGPHAAPWEQGDMLWNCIRDVLAPSAKQSPNH